MQNKTKLDRFLKNKDISVLTYKIDILQIKLSIEK